MGIVKLLQAIRNLTKLGSIKSVDQAYKLAQREVGERFNQIKKQIDDAFNQGKKEQTLDKRTKDIKKIDEQGIKSVETEQSQLMKRLEDKIKNFQNVENISTGLTRTIAREILLKRGIDVPKGRDAIELFREKFGQDVLIDINNLAEELMEMDRMGKRPKPLTEIIEQEGFFDVKMPKEPPQGYTPDELAEIQKEIEQEDILLKFDPTGRKANATGGIMRANYKIGSGLKLAKFLASKGKNLKEEIKKAVDNIFTTDDPKYDADVALDSMLEELDVDREMFDQKDIIDAYGMAYDELKVPFMQKILNKPEKMAPKMTERLELKQKYPGADDEMLDQILEMDPDRKAQMFADMDIGIKLLNEGKGLDEVKDIIEKGLKTRKDNAEGGLNYSDGLSEITDLYEKIRIKNVQTQKDKEDNKQMRFRKLLASNKFPELNTFLEAELNEDDEKVELDVRTNLAVGGSPFTAEQIAQKKQQSYLDYLARQGATAPASTGAGYRGPASSVGTNLFSTPATSTTTTGTGTTGTSGGTGGTSGGGTTSSGGGFSGGSSGGGSSGGGSTGSSGGGTSSGGSNVYTGAGNFPPGMGTNTGGSSTGSSGGSSGLTPNTGNSNVGGGGFGGTGSIVGGGTGSTGTTSSTGTNNQVDTGDLGSEAANVAANQAATNTGTTTDSEIEKYINSQVQPDPMMGSNYDVDSIRSKYQNELSNAKSGGNANISSGVNSGGVFVDPTTGKTYISQDYQWEVYGKPNQGKVGGPGVDAFFGFSDGSSVTHEFVDQSVIDSLRDQYGSNTGSGQVDTGDLGSEAANVAANQAASALPNPYEMSSKELRAAAQPFIDQAKAEWFAANPGATAQDFSRSGGRWIDLAEDIVRRNYREQQAATADDGFAELSDDQKLTDEQAAANREGARGNYSSDSTTATDPGYTDPNQYNRQADLTSPRSDGKYADEVNARNPKPIDIGGGLKKFGGKIYNAAGQVVDTAGRILDSTPGKLAIAMATAGVGGPALQTVSNIKTAVDTVNKGRDIVKQVKDAYDQAIDDGLNQVTGITENIDLREENKTGGRVGFRYGGEKKRVKKYMKPNYDQPFDKISKSERSKFNKLTSTLSSYAKNLNKLKKKKATTAAQKNLLVQNEKARKNALKRLNQLKKLYSGGKSV